MSEKQGSLKRVSWSNGETEREYEGMSRGRILGNEVEEDDRRGCSTHPPPTHLSACKRNLVECTLWPEYLDDAGRSSYSRESQWKGLETQILLKGVCPFGTLETAGQTENRL